MKKIIAVLLSVIMLVGLFAACADNTKNPADSDNPGKTDTPATSNDPEQNDSPDDKEERMQIRWIIHNVTGVVPSADLEILSVLEEKYNVDIIVEKVDVHSTESLGLYWAGGGEPDVITYSHASAQSVPDMVKNGYIRSIPTEYLDSYMSDWMDVVYEVSSLNKEGVLAQASIDGELYVIPKTNPVTYGYIMCIRQDWLDNLGLAMPTNLDELHDVMYAFTYNDPDGNGVNDTYGLHGKNTYFGFGYIANVLGAVNGAYQLQDDGTVVYSNTTENMKAFLKLANQWYEEGIIDPDFMSENQDIMKDKWNNGKIGIVVHDLEYFVPSFSGNLIDSVKSVNPDARPAIIEPFADANGEVYLTSLPDDSAFYGSIMFGANCSDEKMQVVMQIKNDLVKDWEFYKRVYYGVEGVDWEYVDGVIKEIPKDQVDYNSGLGAAFAAVPIAPENLKEIYDAETARVYSTYGPIKNLKVIRNFSLMEGSEMYTLYNTDIETVSDEFWYAAIRGDFDIDAEWDNFIESMYEVGLGVVLEDYENLLS